jgi:hypothetical protein
VQHAEFLFIVAEVAVALSGFAGLVTVISRRSGRSADEAKLDLQRLRNVLVVSLQAAGFALVPYVANQVVVEPDWAWRSSAIVFLAVSIGLLGPTIPRTVGAYRAANEPVPASAWGAVATISLHWLLLSLCAAGLFPAATYLAALLALLFVSATSFVRVFVSLSGGSHAA